MTEIDWNLIKSFVTVAETGSLSAAARKLSASQPAVASTDNTVTTSIETSDVREPVAQSSNGDLFGNR